MRKSRTAKVPQHMVSQPQRAAKKAPLAVGDKVKLTGLFLKNTGQTCGGEGGKVWTVVGFWSDGRQCLVNEPHVCQTDPTGYEDLAPEDRPQWRSIATGNLFRVGTLTSDNAL